MLSPMIKTYFAKRMHIDPSNLVIVSVTPCTAKKAEIFRPEQNAAGRYWQHPDMRDTDYAIDEELATWIKEKKSTLIRWKMLLTIRSLANRPAAETSLATVAD